MTTRLTAAPKGYFDAFDIPIVRGRDFDSGDYANASDDAARAPSFDAVIIGGDLARRLWGDANPLGRRLAMALSGVVRAPRHGRRRCRGRSHRRPERCSTAQVRVYVPYSPINTGVIARTAGPALPMLNAMRKVVAAEAPQMPIPKRADHGAARSRVSSRRPAREQRRCRRRTARTAALRDRTLRRRVVRGRGAHARDRHPHGTRRAERGQVVRMFFAKGLALSAFGLVLGLPLSMIVTRLIATTLNWPLTSSPLLGVAIGAVVLVVASAAVWIPARRASAIDPHGGAADGVTVVACFRPRISFNGE